MSRRAAMEVAPLLLALLAASHGGYGLLRFLFHDAWNGFAAACWALLVQAELAIVFLVLSLGMGALNELREDLERRRWTGTDRPPKKRGDGEE